MESTTLVFALAFWGLLIWSYFWTYFDAKKNMTNGATENDLGSSPGFIVFSMLLLWIVIFPWYLYKRNKWLKSRTPSLSRFESPQRRYCPNCGSQTIPPFKYCSSCGLTLSSKQRPFFVLGDRTTGR